MKKWLSALLVLALLVSGLLSFAGCDDKRESTADGIDTATTLGDTTTVAETESPKMGETYEAKHFSYGWSIASFMEAPIRVVFDGETAELYMVSPDDFWWGEGDAAKPLIEKENALYTGTVTTEGDYKVIRVTAAYVSLSVEGEGAEDYLRERLAEIEEILDDTSLDDEERREYEVMRDVYSGIAIDMTYMLAGMEFIFKVKVDQNGHLLQVAYDQFAYGFVYDETGRMVSSSFSIEFGSNEENHEAPDGFVQKLETTYHENGMPKSYVTYYDEREMEASYFDESGNLIEEQ